MHARVASCINRNHSVVILSHIQASHDAHSAHTLDKCSSLELLSSTMSLTVRNIREVATFLYPAKRKWHRLGLRLNINRKELDKIAANPYDIVEEEVLTEMVAIWLQSSTATWEVLGNTLKTVKEKALAQKGTVWLYSKQY